MTATWKQVERRCQEVGMGFSVSEDRHGRCLTRYSKPQAYTPGGALDVIEYDSKQK